MGGNSKDEAGAERFPPRGGDAAHWEAGAEREGRGLLLPITRGFYEGGGIDRNTDVNIKQAEHGRVIHCDATASGTVRGGESEGRSEGSAKVVGSGGHRLGNGEGKGSRKRQDRRIGNRHGRGGGAGGREQGERVKQGGMERGECG